MMKLFKMSSEVFHVIFEKTVTSLLLWQILEMIYIGDCAVVLIMSE